MGHRSPYAIRPMRPRRDRPNSPLTRFVPASEVTIHKRWHLGLRGPRLGSHGDPGRRHLRPRRRRRFLHAGPGGGCASGARPAAGARALRTGPAGSAPDANHWALGLTSTWGIKYNSLAARTKPLSLSDWSCPGKSRSRPLSLVTSFPRRSACVWPARSLAVVPPAASPPASAATYPRARAAQRPGGLACAATARELGSRGPRGACATPGAPEASCARPGRRGWALLCLGGSPASGERSGTLPDPC